MTRKGKNFNNTFPLDGDFMVIMNPMVEGVESQGFPRPKHSIYGIYDLRTLAMKINQVDQPHWEFGYIKFSGGKSEPFVYCQPCRTLPRLKWYVWPRPSREIPCWPLGGIFVLGADAHFGKKQQRKKNTPGGMHQLIGSLSHYLQSC